MVGHPLAAPVQALQPLGDGSALESCSVAFGNESRQWVVTVNFEQLARLRLVTTPAGSCAAMPAEISH
jgi:hypothetical protein